MANLRCGFYNSEKDPLKLLRYKFENDTKNKPVIHFRRGWFHGEKSKYVLVCPNCKEEHDIADLHYEYKQLVCKCGARYSKEDVVSDYETYCYYAERVIHNMSNDTMHKVNVPTLISESYLYCPECHRTTHMDKLPIENKQRVCPCGRHYSFDEIKLSVVNDKVINSANVYLDDNKISVSIVAICSALTVDRNFYWQTGNMRFTMNLETGYSYITHKGFYYAQHNEIYQHRNPGKKAPVMMNCSYMYEERYLSEYADGKIEELITKYAAHKNLVKRILDKSHILRRKFTNKTFELLDNEMTKYYNNKYSYKINTLSSSIDKNLSYSKAYLPLKNRFINLTYKQIEDELLPILDSIKSMDSKYRSKAYKTLYREANDIALEYIARSAKASKNLRKKISKKLQGDSEHTHYMYQGNKYLVFVSLARHMKNKENVNKLYKAMIEDDVRYNYSNDFISNPDLMKQWLRFRDESYISNLAAHELGEKLTYIRNAMSHIKNIKRVYGEDWINPVEFRTEKQYLNDIQTIENSEHFKELRKDIINKAQLVPFKLEKSALKLTEPENNIHIAKDKLTLSQIGSSMNICVGSYGNYCESGACRIIYFIENDQPVVCLELQRRGKTEDKKDYKYALTQAKLRGNELVGYNHNMHSKVVAWCERHNIEIDTPDMILSIKDEKEIAVNVEAAEVELIHF